VDPFPYFEMEVEAEGLLEEGHEEGCPEELERGDEEGCAEGLEGRTEEGCSEGLEGVREKGCQHGVEKGELEPEGSCAVRED
jgi:hypothetical protein